MNEGSLFKGMDREFPQTKKTDIFNIAITWKRGKLQVFIQSEDWKDPKEPKEAGNGHDGKMTVGAYMTTLRYLGRNSGYLGTQAFG